MSRPSVAVAVGQCPGCSAQYLVDVSGTFLRDRLRGTVMLLDLDTPVSGPWDVPCLCSAVVRLSAV